MISWRQQRVAQNEASFREINERLATGLSQLPDNPELLRFVCECGDRTCEEHIELRLSEFQEVRQDSRWFAVVPGHVFPDAERVRSGSERYQVVEKFGAAVALTDAADPGAPGSQGRRAEPADPA
jgi:hypothetical protein